MPLNSRGQRVKTHNTKKAAGKMGKEYAYAAALRSPKKSASNVGGASVGGA